MATTHTDSEREILINLVGEYFLNNPNATTRSATEYFIKNHIKISNATICDYLNRYKKQTYRQQEINKIIMDNKPDSIAKEDVRKRVEKVCKMYLLENKTIDEISKQLNINYWIIYRDLDVRSKNLFCDKLYQEIKKEMESRKLNNIVRKK